MLRPLGLSFGFSIFVVGGTYGLLMDLDPIIRLYKVLYLREEVTTALAQPIVSLVLFSLMRDHGTRDGSRGPK